ncbi:hypothetical protein VHEMI10454 [[Torrubiella] hemipterigena]|uniref:DUF7893 domain-containing protein n=1 Tax=[Torrubiella] hemipterigena TaxID=1531966 RepID=A0A0A1TRV9_9HYPO|nr:hypothetical protein VHEMI10454 [[Torrubiella] hemipterigena]
MYPAQSLQKKRPPNPSSTPKAKRIATELAGKKHPSSPLPTDDKSPLQDAVSPETSARQDTAEEEQSKGEDEIPEEVSLFVTDNESTVVDSASMDTGESSISPSPSDSYVPPPTKSRIRICRSVTLLLSPRSSYEPFEPPAQEISEAEYLIKLRLQVSSKTKVARLRDFVVYCDHVKYPMEMKALNKIDSRACGVLYFDGIAAVGDSEYFLRRVPIGRVRIDPLGPDASKAADSLYLYSQESGYKSTVYHLGSPAKEYQRFYEPFVWLAQLSRYFVSFLQQTAGEISLNSFRLRFYDWIKNKYCDPDTELWLRQHPSRDFRTSIASHRDLLVQQVTAHLGDD